MRKIKKIFVFIVATIVLALITIGVIAENTAPSKPATIAAMPSPTTVPTAPKVSPEYINALRAAETYSDIMHMSKKAIYKQLTSEFDQYSDDAATYAVENLNADWNANALASARNYRETMNMSKGAIHKQLVSEFGGGFTKEQADYAVKNMDN